MNIDEVYKSAIKQKEHNAWIVAMITHYSAKIQVYQLMVKEWEEELQNKPDTINSQIVDKN